MIDRLVEEGATFIGNLIPIDELSNWRSMQWFLFRC